jgi:hypothetical protein
MVREQSIPKVVGKSIEMRNRFHHEAVPRRDKGFGLEAGRSPREGED